VRGQALRVTGLPATPNIVTKAVLRLIQGWDRWRLRRLARRHPGLDIHPAASSNLATAQYNLSPGARLRIGAGVVTEREASGVRFEIREGAEVVIEDGVWLSSHLGPVHLRAFPGARIRIGPDCDLSACMITAKGEVAIGRRVMIGMGCRVFDSDQHPVDVDHPEVTTPVRIEDHCWLAADVTVLRGVTIGPHSIASARSLVRHSVEPHTVVAGVPAKVYAKIGDRSGLPR
jgi:acetyltransferase-like isoleucine patch superfamily enzyme